RRGRMNARSLHPGHPHRRRTIWRSLWLLILLAHAPATLHAFASAGNAEANWSSLFLLSASNLFFALEILFAPSLHILRDRRCAVVFILVVALLHVGVIEHAPPILALIQLPQFWLLPVLAGALAIRRLWSLLTAAST